MIAAGACASEICCPTYCNFNAASEGLGYNVGPVSGAGNMSAIPFVIDPSADQIAPSYSFVTKMISASPLIQSQLKDDVRDTATITIE